MRITSIRRVPPGAGSVRARLDVELPGGAKLFNIALKASPQGWRVFAPSAFGSASATFTRELAAEIIGAALIEIGEIDHARTTA